MRVALACLLASQVAFVAACGDTSAPRHSQGSGVVMRSERLAFFNDWYADGRIDGVYRCAVVEDAIHRLPEVPPIGSSVLQDFETYAKRVC
jgi:hypothetical protein